jgi:hypothetical protein
VPTGLRKRPVLEIVGWKTPGGPGGEAIPAKPPTPQLEQPTTAPVETPAKPPTPSQSAAKPKPAVKLAAETLDAMGDVKPVTMAEVVDDDIPW